VPRDVCIQLLALPARACGEKALDASYHRFALPLQFHRCLSLSLSLFFSSSIRESRRHAKMVNGINKREEKQPFARRARDSR
jgi:hypothetical protein